MGDFRECCLSLRCVLGTVDCLPEFHSCEILPGKPALEGLPDTFGRAEDCNTLRIRLEDEIAGILVELDYTAFTNLNVITRSVRIRNQGADAVHLNRCLSACLHLPYEGQQMMTLHGSWARERGIQTQEIARGFQGTSSHRGISSHQEHPFLAVTSRDAVQERGDVYAMHFVYSGNFLAQVQRDQFDQLRLVMGIHPEEFSWKLEPGESFQAPEVVLAYSGEGLGGMTRTFHDLYRGHLIRKPMGIRPVLLNNWEATYFDFDEERLLEIAERAATLGIELFVLDDGWFENRPTDSGGLGDWTVDRDKLPNGLDGLGRKIEELGLRFGLWMEPEMVSENSELYRAHPDWAIQTGRRRPQRCRDQLVLDLSRPEIASVCDGGWDCQMVVSKDLAEAAVFVLRGLDAPNQASKRLRLRGLDPVAMYEEPSTGRRWPGDVLCRIGLPVTFSTGDFQGDILVLRDGGTA